MKVKDLKTCEGEIMIHYLNQEELEALKRWPTCAKTHLASERMKNILEFSANEDAVFDFGGPFC